MFRHFVLGKRMSVFSRPFIPVKSLFQFGITVFVFRIQLRQCILGWQIVSGRRFFKPPCGNVFVFFDATQTVPMQDSRIVLGFSTVFRLSGSGQNGSLVIFSISEMANPFFNLPGMGHGDNQKAGEENQFSQMV